MNRLWQLHNLKPHLSELFRLSRDAKFLTTLYAALNIRDGKVIGECHAWHHHQEWVPFLHHLVKDNYGTHKQPHVRARQLRECA